MTTEIDSICDSLLRYRGSVNDVLLSLAHLCGESPAVRLLRVVEDGLLRQVTALRKVTENCYDNTRRTTSDRVRTGGTEGDP